MGMPFLGVSNSYCSCAKPSSNPPTSPDPSKFVIGKIYSIPELPNWCVVKVKYLEAKNYEGEKIMVYNVSQYQIKKQKVLDPHFCDNSIHPSPFARFEPTKKGMEAAKSLLNILAKK